MTPVRPTVKPMRPWFSSGPCPKHSGWSIEEVAKRAWIGRAHRQPGPSGQIREVLKKVGSVLRLPEGYRVGVVPGSDTGAIEMAFWNLLGPRRVDVLVWDTFGQVWMTDIRDQLAIADCHVHGAPYGDIVDLNIDLQESDIVFVWNGTSAGVRVPNADWIPVDRKGLSFCDATSAVFSQDLDWERLDVTTFSWQKVLGGEAAHGIVVLSPRALDRLQSGPPLRPLPKLFQWIRNGKLVEDIFNGFCVNTPSMLCFADCLLALEWVESIGGVEAVWRRTDANFATLQAWIDRTEWVENMAADPAIRSNTSVCMRVVTPWFTALSHALQREAVTRMVTLLEEEKTAYDVGNHRNAPPSLRVWCGSTVETADIEALTGWLDWAYAMVAAEQQGAELGAGCEVAG